MSLNLFRPKQGFARALWILILCLGFISLLLAAAKPHMHPHDKNPLSQESHDCQICKIQHSVSISLPTVFLLAAVFFVFTEAVFRSDDFPRSSFLLAANADRAPPVQA